MSRRKRSVRGAGIGLALLLPATAFGQDVVSPTTPGAEAGAESTGGGPQVDAFQAESTADPLGVRQRSEEEANPDVPVGPFGAESVADPLGGVNTGDPSFGEQGVLPLGQQPDTRGIEGQDLPDASLGARGVDVQGTRVETGFPETNRAARGVETFPGEPGIPSLLDDVEAQARGVRLQGRQVNEELLDVRAEGSRGVEAPEGPRAPLGAIPPRNVPGGGILILPGAGGALPGAGLSAGQGAPTGGVQPVGEGVEPVGQGVAAAGTGLPAPVGSGLEGVEELQNVQVTGRVLRVIYEESVAQVLTDDRGLLTIRGRPQEIALIAPGDIVAMSVFEIGGDVWLAPSARFEPASADVTAGAGTGAISRDLSSPIFEDRGETEGVITGVSPDEGVFLVGGQIFYAHPEQVRLLEPGQFVSVTYGTVGEDNWAAEILVGTNAELSEQEPKTPGG